MHNNRASIKSKRNVLNPKLTKDSIEIKIVFGMIFIFFSVFLVLPMIFLLFKSFNVNGVFSLANYRAVISGVGFSTALGNSLYIACWSAFITTIVAFFLAYAINNTNIPNFFKTIISSVAVLPMLLPTITYGFAIIYSFGKQGFITQLLGFQAFEIYGFNGLLLGYVIYTIPTAFLLINNTFKYIDKKFIIVSKILGDGHFKTFLTTTFKPLITTLGASFIQSFFLSFTDFGIPASVGGEYKVIATTLYNQMLGSIPNFSKGAVVAMIMLIPSIFSIIILRYLEKYNFRYNKISKIELSKNKARDILLTVLAIIIIFFILSVFAIVFIIPFVQSWPYEIHFSLDNIKETLTSGNVINTYFNSIIVAILTATIGTVVAYGSALVTTRSTLPKKSKSIIDGFVQITNTIPGMVLGIAFLLIFSGTSLQCTIFILFICNIVHYFSTPYLMIKNSLSKMNGSFETTGKLMGDSFIKTIFRVLIPNSFSTIIEMFSYYFINAMVTISAVIFIVGARTMVLTTTIKQLQHFGDFEQIFVLSLLILVTNLIVKLILRQLSKKAERKIA